MVKERSVFQKGIGLVLRGGGLWLPSRFLQDWARVSWKILSMAEWCSLCWLHNMQLAGPVVCALGGRLVFERVKPCQVQSPLFEVTFFFRQAGVLC